jgi:hypothetical protein
MLRVPAHGWGMVPVCVLYGEGMRRHVRQAPSEQTLNRNRHATRQSVHKTLLREPGLSAVTATLRSQQVAAATGARFGAPEPVLHHVWAELRPADKLRPVHEHHLARPCRHRHPDENMAHARNRRPPTEQRRHDHEQRKACGKQTRARDQREGRNLSRAESWRARTTGCGKVHPRCKATKARA